MQSWGENLVVVTTDAVNPQVNPICPGISTSFSTSTPSQNWLSEGAVGVVTEEIRPEMDGSTELVVIAVLLDALPRVYADQQCHRQSP